MPKLKTISDIADKLSRDIADTVGNMHNDDLDSITSTFDNTLSAALKKFNSSAFDSEGFVSRMSNLDVGGDKDVVKNVLNSIRLADHSNIEALNQTETLLRRDINNICYQMPEMRDVIYMTRDNIIEANVATGQVSRNLVFKNVKNTELLQTQVEELEERLNLPTGIKDFITPQLLINGEMCVQVTPFSKLFAELEVLGSKKGGTKKKTVDYASVFRESIPNYVSNEFYESTDLYSEQNLEYMMESVGQSVKIETKENSTESPLSKNDDANNIANLLKSIDIHNGSSIMMAEMGTEGFSKFIHLEYMDDKLKNPSIASDSNQDRFGAFMEKYLREYSDASDLFNKINQGDIDSKKYKDIKGCYIQYLDPLKLIPVRLGRRVIEYYYATTTMDLHTPGHPNGIVDLSYQHYMKDKGMVDRLASLIIDSFNKDFLNKNIQLKSEIADVIMAHKFSEGKLSFVRIPESEIVRFTIDEDANGKGHSMIEPTLFSARSYVMLNMYNLLYTLNNTTTRVHYLKSSGLNKNYAAQIQRTIRNFQSRRITIDDIYSFSGVMNKVGGISEMVLPSGRGDYKALETDTIEAVNNPINTDMLEQQRRQALSGTGAPNLLIINALDEVDFAKTVELGNARYQSRCGALKMNLNKGCTKLYQKAMRACTDIEEDTISSFRYVLNNSHQQDLNITSEMIDNYNRIVEVTMQIYGNSADWEDDKGKATNLQVELRKALARKYLPQLDHDELDDIMSQVRLSAMNSDLANLVKNVSVEDNDLKDIKGKKG